MWALQQMQHVFQERIAGPIVVVTDRELALMAAIAMVLPQATNLLCVWHIDKNVLANMKKHFATEEEWRIFFGLWGEIHRAETEEVFDEKWASLEHHVKDIVYAYLENVWIPHKERFVLAWTKKARHFGHVVTSRVEGGHLTLKKWIGVSTGDLAFVYDKLVLAGQQQRQTISQKVAYDRSHTIIRLSGAFWSNVNRKISHAALTKVCKTKVCSKPKNLWSNALFSGFQAVPKIIVGGHK